MGKKKKEEATILGRLLQVQGIINAKTLRWKQFTPLEPESVVQGQSGRDSGSGRCRNLAFYLKFNQKPKDTIKHEVALSDLLFLKITDCSVGRQEKQGN